MMPIVPPSEQRRETSDRQARVAQLLALFLLAEIIVVSLTEISAIYFDETASDILEILHHPGFSFEELTSMITSLKVSQNVTVCIVDAYKNCPW